MKCPKCDQEITNDSLFCEFCGTQVGKIPLKVSSTLLAWIMFLLVICFSAAEMFCIIGLQGIEADRNELDVASGVVFITLLLAAIVNIVVLVMSIILARKNQIRKSTSIALCLMSSLVVLEAITFVSSITIYKIDELYSMHVGNDFSYIIFILSLIVVGVYAIYWLVSKTKHKNLTK